jgi:four helix bundle protein
MVRSKREASEMNRPANSIGLNISEGSANGSNKAFDYHLEIAIGSTFEVAAPSVLPADNAYMTIDEQRELYSDDGQKLRKSIDAFRITLS